MDMDTAGDSYFNGAPLSVADVNLDEFLHAFDDTNPLDWLSGEAWANVQTSTSPDFCPMDADGRSLLYGSEFPQERNEISEPGDRQNAPKVRPLVTSLDSVRPLFDSQGRQQFIKLDAALNGLFFEAGEPNATASGSLTSELHCYRRNLFKINATVSLPHGGDLKLKDEHPEEPIVGLLAQIRAIDNMRGDNVELVKASSKSAGLETTGETQPLPVSIKLDQRRKTQSNPSVTVSWERLQFRKSTIKPTRPAGVKQTYRIVVEVAGMLSSGRTISLTQAGSSPIVVRGRSPKSYNPHQRPQASQTSQGASSQEPAIQNTSSNLGANSHTDASQLLTDIGDKPSDGRAKLTPIDGFASSNGDGEKAPSGNYTYIPMPIMDWSPPVEAFFVSPSFLVCDTY